VVRRLRFSVTSVASWQFGKGRLREPVAHPAAPEFSEVRNASRQAQARG